MGKPFTEELACLQATYGFCLRLPLEPLDRFVTQALCLPLIAIGSGGSLTAAHFACLLHQDRGHMARPATPFDFMTLSPPKSDTAVLFLSAGGGNPDVLTSFRRASLQEVRELGVLCTKQNSPLASLALRTGFATLFESDLPSGKDGFLATNSLFGMLVVLARAYSGASNRLLSFPDDLVSKALSVRSAIGEWAGLGRQTMIVLHGGWSSPIAWDIESKFTEAALGNIQLADYRNFGHGRHHWLAKRGRASSVLALITPEEKAIAARTLSLLPKEVETLRLETDHSGPAATLALLTQAFTIVQAAGEHQGIDPGRPGVPAFGRKLYRLQHRVEPRSIGASLHADTREGVAIHRKTRAQALALTANDLTRWRQAYRAFLRSITKARFGGIILDYDGTLCDAKHRYFGLPHDIVEELLRLLRAGLRIGVATGRGRSVGQSLRNALPAVLHSQIVVGYYNCAHIHPLTEEIDEAAYCEPEGVLGELVRRMKESPSLHSLATLTVRKQQLTLEAHTNVCRESLFDWVQQLMASEPGLATTVVRSTRSVDVLAPDVSKRSIVAVLEDVLCATPGPDLLCIGDQGRWPGNDYALLASRYSLSVDETSDALDRCWNLAPTGYRGIPITLAYLRALVTEDNYARFDTAMIRMEGENEPESSP